VNPLAMASSPTRHSLGMDGAAKTAAEHEILRSTTSARAAGWVMTPKRISLRYARPVTELDMSITDQYGISAECSHALAAIRRN